MYRIYENLSRNTGELTTSCHVFNRRCEEWLKPKGIISMTKSGATRGVSCLNLHGKRECLCFNSSSHDI